MKSKLATFLLLLASAAVTAAGCGDSGGRDGRRDKYPVYGPGSTGNIAKINSAGTGGVGTGGG